MLMQMQWCCIKGGFRGAKTLGSLTGGPLMPQRGQRLDGSVAVLAQPRLVS